MLSQVSQLSSDTALIRLADPPRRPSSRIGRGRLRPTRRCRSACNLWPAHKFTRLNDSSGLSALSRNFVTARRPLFPGRILRPEPILLGLRFRFVQTRFTYILDAGCSSSSGQKNGGQLGGYKVVPFFLRRSPSRVAHEKRWPGPVGSSEKQYQAPAGLARNCRRDAV
jgi:hypothetical protein